VNSSALNRVILATSLVWGALAHAGAADNSDDPARSAVIALGSGNPAQRDKAVKTLLAMGADARRAVVQATHSDDPELRVRASELLLKLPWYLPDDSPEVRRLLDGYGQYDVVLVPRSLDIDSAVTQRGLDFVGGLDIGRPKQFDSRIAAGQRQREPRCDRSANAATT